MTKITKIISLLLLTAIAPAATITVCIFGCTTSSLQHALDIDAACGDTISINSAQIQEGNFTIKDRGCVGGASRIIVTTSRSAWLPIVGAKASPSHLGNLATIRTPNTGPALTPVLTAGVPAKHWTFEGINFNTNNIGSYTDNLILGKGYVAANDSEIPDDIIFSHCYFGSPLPNGPVTGVDVKNAIFGEISNLVVEDSFVGDIAKPGQETHNFTLLTTPGPATYINNFMTVAGIPIFSGGSITDYGVTVSNITVKYNYTWRPTKWLSDPLSPYYADFLANGSYSPCLKNHGEFKWGNGITWQYNGHENMWVQAQCFSQWNGFTNTVRVGGGFDSPITTTLGTISLSDTTHLTWSGVTFSIDLTANIGVGSFPIPNYGVCVNFPGLGADCRPITSFNNGTRSIIVSPPFIFAPAGNFQWWLRYDTKQYLNNVNVSNNVFKNVARGVNTLALDPSDGTGTAGRLTNSSFRHNLFINTDQYLNGGTYGLQPKGFTTAAAEVGLAIDAASYTFDHNTLYSAYNNDLYFSLIAAGYNGIANRQPLLQGFNFTNNLGGPSATYAVVGDGTTGNLDLTMLTYASNSNVKNNGMPGLGNGCSDSNTCTGNIGTTWSDPFFRNSKKLKTATYRKQATDQADIGVDYDTLPMISNINIISKQYTALLTFSLSGPIKDARGIQSCTNEISTSRNLHSDLNTYPSAIPMDPTKFKQVDASSNTNAKVAYPIVSDGRVYWPIGLNNAAVTDDNGVSQDIRLTPSTLYYGRLMCHGSMELYTFTTIGTPSVASTVTVGRKLSTAYDTLRVEYGTTAAFGTTVDGVVDGTTRLANVSIPLATGFTYLRELKRLSVSTVVTGPTRILIN